MADIYSSRNKKDRNIPLSMDALVKLPGIGRKSANVILRKARVPAQGIMVDLHTLRVAPLLGIAEEKDGPIMEQHLMQIFPQKQWDVGMALSFWAEIYVTLSQHVK